MDIKFDKLWKLLDEKKITEKEFQKVCNLSDEELEMLKSNSQHIDLVMLDKLCKGLKCNIADIIAHEIN